MRRNFMWLVSAILLLSFTLPALAASEVKSISFPAISADGETVYFTCWGDIWAAPRDGSEPARRLTVNVAFEGRPIPSPDGSQIAFLSDRFGNYDLYVMPESGGEGTRLTWDDSVDYPYDWKPDGSAVLAYTTRQDIWGLCAYEVPLDGGDPRRISGPDHDDHVFPSYLGDDRHLVYARGPGDWARRNHVGQDCYDLWSYDAATGEHRQLTEWKGNDYWPQPSPDGTKVYFVSDRDGNGNIYEYNMENGGIRQLTWFKDHLPCWPRISSDGDEVVFELFGELWVVPTNGGEASKIPISFSEDTKHVMANAQDVPNNVDELAISPNGNYYAVSVLGDIYILKNPEAYDPDNEPDQNLSRTHAIVSSPGREMQMSWHPKDLKLAYISDRDGQYDVYIYDLVTREEQRITNTDLDEWYPKFAPRAELLAYYTGSRELNVYDLKNGSETLLVEGQLRNGPWAMGYSWSPDAHWITYGENVLEESPDIFLINLEDRKPVNISFNPHWSSSPVFSPDGKYIAFYQDTGELSEIMLLELSPEESTFDTDLLFPGDIPEESEEEPAEESKPDEVAGEAQAEAAPDPAEEPEADAEEPAEEEEEYEKIKVDLDRIHLRARPVTVMSGNAYYPNFDPNSSYILFISSHDGTSSWWTIDIEGGQFTPLGPVGDADPVFTPDGSKLYFAEAGVMTYYEMAGSAAKGRGQTTCVSHVDYDQYAVWEQMLREGWRHLRDSFYDPGMNGVDWNAVLRQYLPRVRDLCTIEEYNQLYREMLGELGGSHLGFYSLGTEQEEQPDSTADFGVDYAEDYDGVGWLVERVLTDGPADQPGSMLYAGDTVVAVNGNPVKPGENRARILRNLAFHPVKLTVRSGLEAMTVLEEDNPDADEESIKEREVVIMPATRPALAQLRYEQWVEDNREAVYGLSHNRVAYQHIQSNDTPSLNKFERELFTESHGKEALIMDMRFNGGGGIAEELVEILDRRPFAVERNRDGEDSPQPAMLWEGPVVVLINAHSYSDAEITPWIMQELGLATIMGEATGGNVLGTYDFSLMDGSLFRLPSWGWYTLNNVDMEGNGCQPDIWVHIDPAGVADGHDNQLEAAVEFLLSKID